MFITTIINYNEYHDRKHNIDFINIITACKTNAVAANGYCSTSATVTDCLTDKGGIKCSACETGYHLNDVNKCE
eukprot:Awhi_evm1s9279